jgi:glycosyltransferase involved in cell wall biosynthesis
VATLTEQLVRRGHDVTLFASGDSATSARLVPSVDTALWHQDRYGDFAPFLAITLGKLAREMDGFDIVHNHLDFVGFPLGRCLPCPMVSTLHGRLDLPEMIPLYEEFGDVSLVSISHEQRRPIPQANWVATVPHGIDLDAFTFNERPTGYLAFLGRIAPDKGLDTAIRVARRSGIPLKIAAREPLTMASDLNARADRQYYDEVIKPLLRGPGVEMIGEVGGIEKDIFLQGAAALLFPIRWPEPFGLVMVEALACGTPVVALRAGSVPEVIAHGETGFICEDEDELVEAVGRIDMIDRASCRAAAERRFSAPRMAERYERVYEELIGTSVAPMIWPSLASVGLARA